MPLKALIAVLLSLFAIASCITRYQNANMADFYNFWGVAAAKQWDPTLQGPYAGHKGPHDGAQKYSAALAERAAQSNDKKLKKAAHVRRKGMYLTSTPFLYASFGVFGSSDSSYTVAWRNYFVIQVLAFAVSIFAVVYVYSGAVFPGLILALTLIIAFVPFHSDLNVGNLNSIQLGGVTLLVLASKRAASERVARQKRLWSLAVFCGLCAMTLLKPNLALFSAAMTLHLIASNGWREFFRWLLPWGILLGLILVVWSGAIFGRVSVWIDWYDKVFGADPGRLIFPSDMGNVSTALWLSETVSAPISIATSMLVAAVLLLAILGVGWTNRRTRTGLRGSLRLVVEAFRDPAFAAATGLILTFALMPLVWFHYYVLLLLPALWLASKPDHGSVVRLAGALSVLLAAGVLQSVVGPFFGWRGLHYDAAALSWVPAWLGVVMVLTRRAPVVPEFPGRSNGPIPG